MREYTAEQQKIIGEAKHLVEKCNSINAEISKLTLEDLKNRSNKNKDQIEKLKFDLMKIKGETNVKVNEAAQIMGIIKK